MYMFVLAAGRSPRDSQVVYGKRLWGGGRLGLLLCRRGRPPRRGCQMATLHDALLQDEWTCACAATRGHLHIVKWARANGCPWDENTCSHAAAGGHQRRTQVVTCRPLSLELVHVCLALDEGHLRLLLSGHVPDGCPFKLSVPERIRMTQSIKRWRDGRDNLLLQHIEDNRIFKAGHTQRQLSARLSGYLGRQPRTVFFSRRVDDSVNAEKIVLTLLRRCSSLKSREDYGDEWFEDVQDSGGIEAESICCRCRHPCNSPHERR